MVFDYIIFIKKIYLIKNTKYISKKKNYPILKIK